MSMWTGVHSKTEFMGQLMQYRLAKTHRASYFFTVVIIAGLPDKSDRTRL